MKAKQAAKEKVKEKANEKAKEKTNVKSKEKATEKAKALVGYLMTLKKDAPFGAVVATESEETDVK